LRTLFSPEDKRKNFTIPEFAEAVGCPPRTIYNYIKEGLIAAYRAKKVRGAKYRIHRHDGEIWWANMHEGDN